MKRVKLQIQQSAINKNFGVVFDLSLDDKATVIVAIKKVDEIIKEKGKFPLKEYGSLLHMVYNPLEKRFYTQTAITAYAGPQKFIHVRSRPEMSLPEGTEIIIRPEGPCVSEWDDVIDYETFQNAQKKL